MEEDSQHWNSSALHLIPTGLFQIAQCSCKWKLELTLQYKVCVKYGEESHVDLVNTMKVPNALFSVNLCTKRRFSKCEKEQINLVFV